MSTVAFDQVLANQAAERLDALADLLDGNLRQSAAALAPVPAGTDTVSRHAAATAGSVSESYQQAYRNGVQELRKVAANVRLHMRLMTESEAAGAQLFPPVV
jgi:hypothetical protein